MHSQSHKHTHTHTATKINNARIHICGKYILTVICGSMHGTSRTITVIHSDENTQIKNPLGNTSAKQSVRARIQTFIHIYLHMHVPRGQSN